MSEEMSYDDLRAGLAEFGVKTGDVTDLLTRTPGERPFSAGASMPQAQRLLALLRAVRADAIAALGPPQGQDDGWLPIPEEVDTSKAPFDDGGYDLWCVAPDDNEDSAPGDGIRLADCGWHVADIVFPHTGWARVTDDGNMDLVDGPPSGPCGLPRWVPTHWRRRPAPPQQEGGGE